MKQGLGLSFWEIAVKNRKVLVTGGAGYVGVKLVKKLYEEGYEVVVYDLFWFIGTETFDSMSDRVTIFKADIRDFEKLKIASKGCSDFIHLACISNDPSYDLNPELSKSINYDCFEDIVKVAKSSGISRFIYASSSSVYGVKDVLDVTENLELNPLTDYSKYKALCEEILFRYNSENFTTVAVRPATVCGYSERLRLDVVVNILTNFAVNKNMVKVFGGSQKRPNIHIDDMVNCYLMLLEAEAEKIEKETFNAGGENHTVLELANIIASEAEVEEVVVEQTDDLRSYHISSKYIEEKLGFVAKKTIRDAVRELISKFKDGSIPNSFEDDKYFNVKYLSEKGLDENSH